MNEVIIIHGCPSNKEKAMNSETPNYSIPASLLFSATSIINKSSKFTL